MRVYLNGISVPLTAVFGPETIDGQLFDVNYLFLGRRQMADSEEGTFGAAFYKGLMDEVRLYNRALSASEIQTIYSA